MTKKSKLTDSVIKQEDQVAQTKFGLASVDPKSHRFLNGKEVTHGKKRDVVAKEKSDEEEFDLNADADVENASDPIILAEAKTGTATDAAASSASSAAGGAGAEAGATAGSGAAAGGAAGAAAISGGTLGLVGLGVVGVAAAASGGGGAAAASATGFNLVGVIALGRVSDNTGLTVEAFKADGTMLAGGTGTVNPDGTYIIAVTENYTGPVLIRLKDTNSGTNYMDEGLGVLSDLTTDLRVVVNVSGNGTIQAMLTPLTELAVRELLGDGGGDGGTAGTTLGAITAAQATAANDSVEAAFGLTGDIVTTAPVTVDVGTVIFTAATAAQQAYGHVLAAISGAETNLSMDTGEAINAIAQGLTGSVLSQSVVDELLAGAVTVDTVAATKNLATPGSFATGTAAALDAVIGSNLSGIGISADTGSPGDFITYTAAQTITATLDTALSGTKLWGSVDGGATWTDISSFVPPTTTSLSWTGVTLNSGDNLIKFALTANTVASFTGAAADIVLGTKVTVQNYGLDTAPPAFTSSTTANFAENGTSTAYTAVADDAHLLTYTWTGTGNDDALFNLDPNSGAVTFITAPNFEAPSDAGGNNVYDINITATDGAGNIGAQAVAITVTDVNEAPTLTSSAAASFVENGTGTVYTAAATDPENAALTYALGGTDAARFNIAASTGAVTFAATPNFESPTDAGGDNVYNITVTASDGTLTTAAQAVAITVTGVNETPTLTSGAAASFAENGTGMAYAAAATDPDAGATLTYALAGTDAALFNISASTGAITFAATPNFEVPTDADGDHVYNITVTASDGTNTTTPQAVAITVTDVNEAPTSIPATSSDTIAVNQAFSANIFDLFSDVDAGNVFSYSATGLPAGMSLNTATGDVSGTPTATGTATIVFTATDNGGLTASHTVTVNVVSAPVISSIAATVAQAQSGSALTFLVDFTEAVTVVTTGGTPTLTLNVGGTPMTATYISGTGNPTLTFTATATAGDSAAVSVTAINLNGGTITGNTTVQPLVTTAVGQAVSAFVIDNTNPAFTSAAAASVAENQTAAYTSATTDATAVTYALSGGADANLFNINENTGAVTFKVAPDREAAADADGDHVYNIAVTATDALGHAASQNVAITVTNVNEAPTVTASPPSTQTFVVNQVIAANNDVTGLFTDVDGDTLTYSQTGLPTGVTFNSGTGLVSGTPTTTGTANVTFTATDAGGLSASHTIAVSIVSAPTLTSNIDNVANFDVTGNIVLTASSVVTKGTGFIRIVNDANDVSKAGFHGETTTNTQTIDVASGAVSIASNTITINPGFDLDLANNYHIEVDAGAFMSGGLGSVAVTGATAMNFSTVTPGSAAGGVAGAVASQKMADGTDAMAASYGWWDIETLGSTITSAVSGDLSAGNIAAVFKDYDPLPGDANVGYTGIGSPGDDYVNLLNFGNGDLLYVDNQANAAPNDLTQAALIHSGTAPVQLQVDGYTPQGGMPIWVDITTTAGGAAVFLDVAGFRNLLSLAYDPIVSA